MPDTRSHRGPHPEDARLFSAEAVPALRAAVADLAWLQGRGYGDDGSLKLVGDRYRLDARQRAAVRRGCCSDEARGRRLARKASADALRGRPLMVDAYNVLTTLEVALGGGVVLRCRDTAHRDIAGLHGTWRRTVETPAALLLVGRTLDAIGASGARFLLDAPVSNSGRLATLMRDLALRHRWTWEVELVPDPDPVLVASAGYVATADGVILDGCASWVDLAGETIARHVPGAWVVELATAGS